MIDYLAVTNFSFFLYDWLIAQLFCTDVVAAAVLSGNRNFEGRVHPLTRANYLASPPLVVAYALAGTVSTFLSQTIVGLACSINFRTSVFLVSGK